MKGAKEYAELFETGQYGKLYIISSQHARGKTFHIYIRPKNDGLTDKEQDSNTVEVYGIISGNPGWTEEYGWLHKGKWQEDFENLVAARKERMAEKIKVDNEAYNKAEIEKAHHINELLNDY